MVRLVGERRQRLEERTHDVSLGKPFGHNVPQRLSGRSVEAALREIGYRRRQGVGAQEEHALFQLREQRIEG